MKLPKPLIFAAGYILGARAGRERYAQLIAVMEKASQRLEEFSSRHPPGSDDAGTGGRRRRP